MKENLKNRKGITLIALVITIIVLLILAIVTIRIVVNQNIINHANNAVTAYNEAQQNETAQLTWAEELMKNKGGSSSSESSSNSQTNGQNLLQLTEQEIKEILDSGSYDESNIRTQDALLIARNQTTGATLGVMSDNNLSIDTLQIVKGDKEYLYCNENSPLLQYIPFEIKTQTWYELPSSAINSVPSQEDFTEYTGSSPISSLDFTEIASNTFLNRVIASFNS